MIGEYTASEMLVNMGSATLEEFYPAVAIATLMRIMRDSSLANHHTGVVQGITFIFKSLGIKCVPYIQQVIPAYLTVIRTADPNFRDVRILHHYNITVNFTCNNIQGTMEIAASSGYISL